MADVPLTAIVGDRIDWDTGPQGQGKPYVALHLVSGVPDYHTSGASGLVGSRVQIDCVGKSKTAALSASRAVEAVLSAHRGTTGAIKFQGIFKIGARSDFEKTDSEKLFRQSDDYAVWHGAA